jgi:hypothetical protein
MIHRYVWMDGCSYNGAPNTNGVKVIADELDRPRLILAGDNHKGFWHSKHKVFNCGSLMRLNRDQYEYRPRVGIVYSDCSIIPYYLKWSWGNISRQTWSTEHVDTIEREDQVDDFLKELSEMGRGGLDFLDAVRRYAEKNEIKPATRKLIESIMEG